MSLSITNLPKVSSMSMMQTYLMGAKNVFSLSIRSLQACIPNCRDRTLSPLIQFFLSSFLISSTFYMNVLWVIIFFLLLILIVYAWATCLHLHLIEIHSRIPCMSLLSFPIEYIQRRNLITKGLLPHILLNNFTFVTVSSRLQVLMLKISIKSCLISYQCELSSHWIFSS